MEEGLMGESWRDIVGYEGFYQISNLGNVKSLSRHRVVGFADYKSKEKIIKQSTNNGGYKYVWLHKNGKRKIYKIHRLVAMAFLKNPLNYRCINHKDENRQNNIVENLEWCNHSYNNSYGTRIDKFREKVGKPVLQYTKDGVFIKEWCCTRVAERSLCIRNIYACCNGKRKSVGGFVWRYKEKLCTK
jgi:hypothetical protein